MSAANCFHLEAAVTGEDQGLPSLRASAAMGLAANTAVAALAAVKADFFFSSIAARPLLDVEQVSLFLSERLGMRATIGNGT